MIPTPDLSHLSRADYEHIYEPAEDTFILLDALERDEEALRRLRPSLCLEIGSGSGCVSAFLAKIVGSSRAAYLCTDINPLAARATSRTGSQNGTHLEAIVTSLHYSMLHRLKRCKVDVLLFNPPYVPTEEQEESDGQVQADLSAAWAGGTQGMNSTEMLLQAVPELLSETGRFYLVAIQQNRPQDIISRMSRLGLRGQVALKRRAGGEILYVLLFTKGAVPSAPEQTPATSPP